ncbi:hypothetical protein ACH0BZ_00010 [Dietzia sp. 179-F 9C3 NHS]
MPMHYPPLSDGTYRVGDPPQPRPSPVPGPDPVSAPAPGHHQHGQLHPAGPPPLGPPADGTPTGDDARPERSPGLHAAIAAGSVFAVVAVVALGLALFGGTDRETTDPITWPAFPSSVPSGDPAPGASEFPAGGTFVVTSSPGEPVSGDAETCSLPVTLSDIGEGTLITLLDATRAPITESMLSYDGGTSSSCTYTFGFEGVPAGESFYVVEIQGRGQLVYTERELRDGVDITLGR